MRTLFAPRNVNYLVAIVFTIGCTTLVVNAFLAFLPFVDARFELPYKIIYVEAILTFIVCFLFLIGSFLAYLETMNADSTTCFPRRLEHLPSGIPTDWGDERGNATTAIPNYTQHQGSNKTFTDHSKDWDASSASEKGNEVTTATIKETRSWKLFPAARELRTRYLHDIDFLSCAISLCSSFLYCGASLAALVTLLSTDKVTHWIRIIRLIAAVGFTISSVMCMGNSQDHWWRPAARRLGWHICLWNLIGSCGFTLCAALGLISSEQWAQYQLYFSYFWGKFIPFSARQDLC